MTTRELFTELFTQHAARVRAMAALWVHGDDRDLVEDLVQEAFLRLWVYLQRGNTVANPAGLLGTLVRRAAAGHYRLARNTREGATDFTDPLAARCVPAAPSAEQVALLHADIERLLADAMAEVNA